MAGLEIPPLSELRDEAAALVRARFARARGGALEGEPKMARWQFGGHAAREPEALRDLFAHQAPTFDVSRFMVTVPASEPELLDAWFRLASGCQAVWAVREAEPAEPVEFGSTIRLATPDDTEAIVDL